MALEMIVHIAGRPGQSWVNPDGDKLDPAAAAMMHLAAAGWSRLQTTTVYDLLDICRLLFGTRSAATQRFRCLLSNARQHPNTAAISVLVADAGMPILRDCPHTTQLEELSRILQGTESDESIVASS